MKTLFPMKPAYLNKVLYWLPLTIVAVLNGAVRTLILDRFLTDFHSHQLSSLLLIVLILLYTKAVYNRLNLKTAREAWLTGIIWLLLTVAFEFAFGYFVSGASFESLFEAYDLLTGNFWTLVLVGTLIIPPWLYFTIHEKNKRRNPA